MNRHYESDELLAYLEGNDAIIDQSEVSAHLSECPQCTDRLANVRLDYVLLSDPDVWEGAGETRDAVVPPSARLDEYIAIRQRMADEAARAEVVFNDLLKRPLDSWVEHLVLAPEECTAGMVARLTAAARDDEERDPKHSLQLLAVAETVATFAYAHPEEAEVLGDLWKERANVYTILGDYPSAHAAIDSAEQVYARGSIADYKLAFTAWSRANLFLEMERYADGLPLAERAAATFAQFADVLHENQARVVVACLLYEQGNLVTAERIFLQLLEHLERAGDSMTYARVLTNLGCCRLFQGDLSAAEAYAQRAIEIYIEFGLETAIVRTRWAFGIVYLRRGESDRGVDALNEVAAEYWKRELPNNAAAVELDIVAEYIRRREYQRAAVIAARLHAAFAKAGLRISAAKALAFLHEAALADAATPELVRAVRHVVTHPEQPFVAPPQPA
jgi:tetratricopeptide (TPR) repeat protein